ncbi:MAG: pyridoxal phosphate-dependent aminotransferase [Xanthomonadales bacterium]|nr:pyridoxal phosphate-dependent aminotransferase [Xanthomonadales bacterium]
MRWSAQRMKSQVSKGFGMYEVAAQLQSAGANVIHLEVGRPSADTPKHIKEAAKAALDAGKVHYSELQGIVSLREALAERYARDHQLPCSEKNVLITNGVTQAAFATFMSVLDEGDEVITFEPFYPQHNSKVAFAGGKIVSVPMRKLEGQFRIDLDALELAVSPKTKMLILVNPTNPTGTVYNRIELEALAKIVAQHDLLVLADEVYEFILFDSAKHISFASLPGMWERTITVSAFTKAYAMDGWRLGYAVAPEPMIKQLQRVTMNDTTHPCVFAQDGGLAAVQGSQDCVKMMVEEDRLRRNLVVKRLNAMPGVFCSTPEASIYAFPKFSGLDASSSELALDILHKVHVATESGSFYGASGEGHLRLCFGSEPYARLAEAMDRIESYLQGAVGS